MGKRQLGELQPFEFAITLVASELACIPMADSSIPILYGILPVFTLFLLHFLFTKIANKSVRFRSLLNGRPVIVIEKGNIQYNMLKQLDMDINDLVSALREAGYFSPANVEYAIIETNGKLSVLPKFANSPTTNADLRITGGTADLPAAIIIDGKFMGETFENMGLSVTSEEMKNFIRTSLNLSEKDILLLTVTDDLNVFCQPYKTPAFNTTFEAA
ncbi:MAG: DUF421 domain-containing protein [Clostridiaceae bacterium]|jgi:uncharacterized membrane protein YcaP (DUF421 family)|nr:DUF421 domain-containing protein [Clostridiaceae bacterium]